MPIAGVDGVTTVTRGQLRFASWVTDVLVYIVVLNLFVQYVPKVITESFTVSIFTAVVLKLLIDAIAGVERRVSGWFNRRQGKSWRVLGLVAVFAILFISKFVVLEVIGLVFGDRVYARWVRRSRSARRDHDPGDPHRGMDLSSPRRTRRELRGHLRSFCRLRSVAPAGRSSINGADVVGCVLGSPGAPRRPSIASVARYATTTPTMMRGSAPAPALAHSAEAMMIAERGRRRNATNIAPIQTGTATEDGRPGRCDSATPPAAPMSMAGKVGPPRKDPSEIAHAMLLNSTR